MFEFGMSERTQTLMEPIRMEERLEEFFRRSRAN